MLDYDCNNNNIYNIKENINNDNDNYHYKLQLLQKILIILLCSIPRELSDVHSDNDNNKNINND